MVLSGSADHRDGHPPDKEQQPSGAHNLGCYRCVAVQRKNRLPEMDLCRSPNEFGETKRHKENGHSQPQTAALPSWSGAAETLDERLSCPAGNPLMKSIELRAGQGSKRHTYDCWRQPIDDCNHSSIIPSSVILTSGGRVIALPAKGKLCSSECRWRFMARIDAAGSGELGCCYSRGRWTAEGSKVMNKVPQSSWITGTKVVQLSVAASWLGVVVFLLWLIRAPETRQVPDPRAAVWGLEVAVGIVAPIALLGLAGAYGTTRNRLWGWWVALLVDLAAVLMLVFGMIDDGWKNIDPALVSITAASAAPIVLLLLPGVRRFYWGKPATASARGAVP